MKPLLKYKVGDIVMAEGDFFQSKIISANRPLTTWYYVIKRCGFNDEPKEVEESDILFNL